MATSFAALPVGQGDAFLVSSDAFSALIDGGRSRAQLSELVAKHLRARCVEVVACTHNDADHVEGVIGLLEKPDFKVCQVWLPGQWTSRLHDLLVAPEAFMDEVLLQLAGLPDEGREGSLADLAENYVDANDAPVEGPPIVEVLDEAVESAGTDLARPLRQLAAWWFPPSCPFRRVPPTLFWQALDAAERIRQIACLAWKRAAEIHWFAVDSAPGTARPRPLSPVNSREILHVSRPRVDALQFLALSVSNRRSLCFEFRPGPTTPAALLAGDSDLKFSAPISWSEGMIVTAPHHGSDSNASAYQRASRESSSPSSILWVRSDGRFRSRPGQAFLRQTFRYCTRCRPYNQEAQTIRFTARGGSWIGRGVRCCTCAS